MEKVKIKCNRCQTFTLHKLVHEYEQNLSEDHFSFTLIHSLFECCGCQDVKMIRKELSDYCDMDENGYIPEITVFPPDTLRAKPLWLPRLIFPFNAETGPVNSEIIGLINEIYISVQNSCYRLTVMGIRALIEAVMIQKVGDKGNFQANMKAFQEQGYISEIQCKALEQVLNAGHATIHRSYNPGFSVVTAAIDIVENVIESIYVVEAKKYSFSDVPVRGNKKL